MSWNAEVNSSENKDLSFDSMWKRHLKTPRLKKNFVSSFFLTLAEHFQTQEKLINGMMEGYSSLRGTIRQTTNRQRSVLEEIVR